MIIRKISACILLIGVFFICMCICIGEASAEEKPDIEKIVIEGEKDRIMVGNDSAVFYAMVLTSDGEVVRNSEYAKVRWYIKTTVGKIPLDTRINDTCRPVTDENSKYYGCYCVTVSAPYGTPTNFYRVFAENVKMPMFDQEKEICFIKDYNDEHFITASKGNVDYGTINGEVPTVTETYDCERDAYLIKLPKNNFSSKYYDFVGWKYESNIYKPGQTIYVNANSKSRRIVAQWKAKFSQPEVVVTKGKKMLMLDWPVIAGANGGYKIYRSTKRNGKYKQIKSYWYYRWNYFEDEKVKKAKTYWYKIKAIKKENGKRIVKTSEPVKMSLKYSNVKSIKLNRKKITGKVGLTLKMKAKVKRKGKKKYRYEKVSWYTTDKRIAKIGKQSGIIKLVSTGKCSIYCRTFNGKRCKEISVTVK